VLTFYVVSAQFMDTENHQTCAESIVCTTGASVGPVNTCVLKVSKFSVYYKRFFCISKSTRSWLYLTPLKKGLINLLGNGQLFFAFSLFDDFVHRYIEIFVILVVQSDLTVGPDSSPGWYKMADDHIFL